MASSTVRMVLIEGEDADGGTLDEDNFEITPNGESTTSTATDQVIAAILGTREGAADRGYQLTSIGVTWSDQIEASALQDALAARKIENVMLVSAFLAAAALAQTVGNTTNCARTALLFVEPDTVTLAVVDCTDGSIADVHRRPLPDDDNEALAELTRLVSGVEALDARPAGLFVVGCGVDIPLITRELQAATSLPVTAPEKPDMALARGAALASANAPLFVSSTAALAYAQDPGTGAVDPYAISPGYLAVAAVCAGAEAGEEDIAYSADPDENADAYAAKDPYAYTEVGGEEDFRTGMFPDFGVEQVEPPHRKPFLVAMSVMIFFVVGVVALVIALAVSIRPSVDQRPSLAHSVVAPTKQAPPPPAVPPPSASPPSAPAEVAAPQAPAAAGPPMGVPVPGPAPLPPAGPPRIPPIIPELLAPRVQGPPLQPRGGDHRGGWGDGGGNNVIVGGPQINVGGGGVPGLPGIGGGDNVNVGGPQINMGGGGVPGLPGAGGFGIPGIPGF